MEISTAAAKSPDTDQAAETPKIHPGKPLPFTNGVLKRHAPPHAPVSYKECMKNHAAAMGGHALDGCGEFMPSPSTIPSDPTSLTCAACGCHRNFHRRNSPPPAPPTHVIEYHPNHRHHPPPPYNGGLGGARSPGGSPSPPPISSSYYPTSAPHMLLALSSGGGAGGCEPPLTSPHSRKRFRTKFSQDQKDKMHEFAEKLGWKMQKASDDLVSAFCADVGVERGVFKVWMHNNKNTFAKHRDPTAGPAPALPAPAGTALIDPNGSSGNSSHGYSKNGDGTYGSSTSS